MTEHNAQDFADAINLHWRDKFTPEEIAHMFGKWRNFRLNDVQEALDTHKSGPKGRFKPSVYEITALLKGKEIDGATGFIKAHALTYAHAIRKQWRDSTGDTSGDSMSDYEVLLRHYAGIYQLALEKLGGKRKGETEVQDALEGYRKKIAADCRSALLMAGLDGENALRFAACVVDPTLTRETFRYVLDDLCGVAVA